MTNKTVGATGCDYTSWDAAFTYLAGLGALADDFTFTIRSQIPLSGGLGSSAAAIVAGAMAADHLFELDADLLAHFVRILGRGRK